MNKPLIVITLLMLSLTGCGGNDTKSAANSESNAAEVPQETGQESNGSSNNFLEKEQQLIKDAEAIQGILDKNANAKKQSMKDST